MAGAGVWLGPAWLGHLAPAAPRYTSLSPAWLLPEHRLGSTLTWADKESSLIAGKRVARDMPFSRDRIPRVCRVGRGTPRPTRAPRYFLGEGIGGEGIGRDVAQRYRPFRDLALLGYAECCRQKSGRVAQRPLRPPHPRPISPGHTGGEGSTGLLRATATLMFAPQSCNFAAYP